jgi:hypothetical protein
MDIVITRDNFQTLANIIIVDLIHPYLVQCASMTTHAVTIVVHDKAQFHIEQALRDDFIPLAIETYSCLYPCFNSFLISCAHACIARHQ